MTPACDSVALWWVLASSAWPRKNVMKLATTVTPSATTPSTSVFAANTVGRRGITDSEVRIIPVEYSEVSTIAPSTTITSWPR